MSNIFTKHPHSIGETYFQHMRIAIQTGVLMVVGGLACTLHAFFPFLFPNTAKKILFKLVRIFLYRMPKDDNEVKSFIEFMETKVNDYKNVRST